jgi:hypothetical protein
MTGMLSIRGALRKAPLVLGVAAMAVFLGACSQVGTPTLTFWDVIWSMVVLFFWVMAIWIFIAVFADIFRRNDISGGVKAVWILALIILPFLGAIIYMVMRPKVTAQDVQMAARAEAASAAVSQVSTADELAKLQQLKASGTISDAEFEALKAKLLA